MPINGDLKTISLCGILQLLCHEAKTGILRVFRPDLAFQIIFLEGEIVYAVKPFTKDRLGSLMQRDGILTAEQLSEAMRLSRERQQALGKSLVEQGVISEGVLSRYLYLQIEEVLYRLFLWEDGLFEFKDSAPNLNWLLAVKLNTLKMIMAAAQRADEQRTTGLSADPPPPEQVLPA